MTTFGICALAEDFRALATSETDNMEDANMISLTAVENVPEIAWLVLTVTTEIGVGVNILSREEFLAKMAGE